MGNIQMITDSMTDIPKELQEKYSIKMIPLTITFGQTSYLDGVEIEMEEFYQRLSNTDVLPQTSQVTPIQFQNAFQQALEEGNQVLCINASSRASGTHQSALIAKETIGSNDIQVVDTLGLCMGAGLTVIETARFLESDHSLDEASAFARKYSEGMKHIFTVDTVTYLQKGGRIAPGKALVANILNIKPILTVTNGLVEPLDKVRGSRKVIEKMIELTRSTGEDLKSKTIAIAHANARDQAEELRNKIIEMIKPKEIIMSQIGCTIGTHTGPGTLAIFLHE